MGASSSAGSSRLPSGIVVGIDGSPASRAALAWALAEAKQRGADLDVVVAWTFPNQWAEGFNVKWAADSEFFAKAAVATADAAVSDVLAGESRPGWLRTHGVEGSAASVLLHRARDAELLVVGTRGRGGFADLLLGSVSTACVHHSPCPITVVPMPVGLPDQLPDTTIVETAT
jgi:nucleotide-binding universal stress UspA family protein